jgi:hypothetical protein
MKRLDFERVQSLILNSISILILFLFCLNKKETKNSRTTGSLRAFVQPSQRYTSMPDKYQGF